MAAWKRILSIFLFVLVFQTSFAQSTPNCKALSKYAYVLNAKSAILEKAADSDDDNYTLTLHKVDQYVPWVTGRQGREFGTTKLKNFYIAWDHGDCNFGEQPPNAELTSAGSFISLFSKPADYGFVISNPRYLEDEHTLTFDAKLLSDKKPPVQKALYNVTLVIVD